MGYEKWYNPAARRPHAPQLMFRLNLGQISSINDIEMGNGLTPNENGVLNHHKPAIMGIFYDLLLGSNGDLRRVVLTTC